MSGELSPEAESLTDTLEALSLSSRRLPGRLKKSFVWDYFQYDLTEDKSVCKVQQPDESVCGKSISGKYPTNLK